MPKSAIVIGAGIVGLATARSLAIHGYRVTVIERSDKALGASIRNFGMIWPIGQTSGKMYERAMLSKEIWKTVCMQSNIWYDEVGSLHMAYNELETQVLQEFYEEAKNERHCSLLSKQNTLKKSGAVVAKNLQNSLYSKNEMIVDPREAITKIPTYLENEYGVKFIWSSVVTSVCHPSVRCGKKVYEADEIFICSGSDFEVLYPEFFASLPLTKCKLQMMRVKAQPENWRIGPALCGGLSLIHYKSFSAAPSLELLKEKFKNELSDYVKWGIHVMVAQNEIGELVIGDSHEYGNSFDPFDNMFINEMILDYLKKFATFKNLYISQTWNGIYPKLTNEGTEIVLQPQDGVTIINGLGGAGMTLSFGLCEQVVSGSYNLKN